MRRGLLVVVYPDESSFAVTLPSATGLFDMQKLVECQISAFSAAWYVALDKVLDHFKPSFHLQLPGEGGEVN